MKRFGFAMAALAAVIVGCGSTDGSTASSEAPIDEKNPAYEAPSGSTAPTTPKSAAECAGLDENACVAKEGCEAGYKGLCDCSCPGPFAPPGADVSRYEARECTDCGASCHTFAACVPKSACEGADEETCRSQPGCRVELAEQCDCSCADPEAKECAGCSATCRPFVACHTR